MCLQFALKTDRLRQTVSNFRTSDEESSISKRGSGPWNLVVRTGGGTKTTSWITADRRRGLSHVQIPCNSPCMASPAGLTNQRGLGLDGSIHEKVRIGLS